ncbi:flagellar hook-length control protein FliK [Tenuibacillus multivorans]|uniref:Hook-length control protein FliK n=1 Tax=Tenuibacillus multivorans TaxID=237069 RepID=A0A1G9XZR1_9BACI|nr:flagellar hook-length control protein FliK [Tenuibacillus multivorans]GEL75875.1 hypothetical protein TMU01_01100 [Tenuibacillus multivorans]SDN01921.1 hook-length control protein FliK [Tenuibacillus multivorans]
MNATVLTALLMNGMPMTQNKSQASTNQSNAFQQLFSQLSINGEKHLVQTEQSTDILAQLKELLGKDLAKLLSDLENGEVEQLPDEFSNQLIQQLSQLSNLTGEQFTEALDEIVQNVLDNHDLLHQQDSIKNDDSLKNHDLLKNDDLLKNHDLFHNQEQLLQFIGAFILQHIDQSYSQNQESLIQPNAKNIQQGEALLAKILSALGQLNEQTQNQQNLANNLKDSMIPKEWTQKWQELLTRLQTHKNNQQMTQSSNNQQSIQMSTSQMSKQAEVVATKLVDSIQQLLQGSKKTMDQSNLNFFVRQVSDQSQPSQKVLPLETMQLNSHMTRQEQLMIHHTRPSQHVIQSSNQQQMIDQLQELIQTTRFGKVGGKNQLSIQLKPSNLGEMMIRFTQIDGQMTVKISVMAQGAKEMLEQNLHQLRHMFSPNQVVIERQVEQANTDYTQQFMDDDQSQQEENQQEQDHDPSDSSDDQQDKSFKDYLFEEEV